MDFSADFCRIGVSATDERVTIRVYGDVDLASAPLLDAAFAGVDGWGDVEVDLSGTTFCDGAGLRVLDLAHRRFGDRMRVTGASPTLRRLAAVLDMDWFTAEMPDRADGVRTTSS